MKDPNILILVEDPSEDFVKLRDYVDVKLALEMIPALANPGLKCFTDELAKVMLPLGCSLTHKNQNLVDKVFKTDCSMCLKLKNLGMSLAHDKQMIG